MTPLRIALLDQAGTGRARELDAALRQAGHEPRLFGSRALAPVEGLLRRRGFTPALSHVPLALVDLLRAEFDVAHAFSAPDAMAALAWRRARGGAVVFTSAQPLERANVANGRLRLATLTRALDDPDAVLAADEEVRASVERWFALSLTVLSPADAEAHERLYRKLLGGAGG